MRGGVCVCGCLDLIRKTDSAAKKVAEILKTHAKAAEDAVELAKKEKEIRKTHAAAAQAAEEELAEKEMEKEMAEKALSKYSGISLTNTDR